MKSQQGHSLELYSLFRSQEWLADYEDQTISLLNLAKDQAERSLLLEILHGFEYVTSERLAKLIDDLTRRVCCTLGLSPTTSQIVATAFDNEPDSSQLLLQMLKQKLPEYGGAKFRLKAKGMAAIGDLPQCPNIIMVDEFSGTGTTIVSRVRNMEKAAAQFIKQKGIQVQPRIVVCLLSAMQGALQKIKAEGIEVHAELEIPAGISGRNSEHDACIKRDLMRSIEKQLDATRMTPFPSLGYGEAEAAFAITHVNAPNSNFPILWWRHLANRSILRPLLLRNEPNYEY